MEIKASSKWNAIRTKSFKRLTKNAKLKTKNRDSASDSFSRTVIQFNMRQMSRVAGGYARLTTDSNEEISESDSAKEESSDDVPAAGHAFFLMILDMYRTSTTMIPVIMKHLHSAS